MAEEKQKVEAEEHIKALAKIWKPKPKPPAKEEVRKR